MWNDGTVWDRSADGALLLRACRNCTRICHPPLPMCPHCQSIEWDRREASGRATLKSWLVSPRAEGSEEAPRIVIVAELQEGVGFVSNLVGTGHEELHEGMPLTLLWEQADGLALPLFRPA